MRKGQSITEYALALGLVGIAALGSVLMLGNGIQTGLNTAMMPGMQGANPQVARPAAQANPPAEGALILGGANGGIGGIVSPPLPGQEKVCFGSGLCANIAVVPENTQVDVAGGKGGEFTHKFANTLQEIADQIQAEGVDPGLAQQIKLLAERGHDMGDLQGEFTQCETTRGPQQNREEGGCFSGSSTSTNVIMDHSQVLDEFKQQYQDVVAAFKNYKGAVKADAMTIISSQSQQIMNIGKIFTPVRGGSWTHVVSASNESFGMTDLDTVTHQSANTICDQGGKGCKRVIEPKG